MRVCPKSNYRRVLLTSALLTSLRAASSLALPIGFEINQETLEYAETKSDHFIVYHDARVPTEGAMTLNALEAARPLLERWLGQHRHTPLPVVMSAVTEDASFADFVTDAIELQTKGQGYKELAWHEYTHSTMYRALDNALGPAGSIIHLPWMPAWFLEGLAEATSVSVGSDVTAGIERYQALTGDWPSYDRLHSLYSKVGFQERGYATSGALVSYLLRKGDPGKVPAMLQDFFDYSLPWWWPWAAVPFNGFMPMDQALTKYVGMNGQDLYKVYKRDAERFWKSSREAPFLVGEKAEKLDVPSAWSVVSDGQRTQVLHRFDGDLYESEVIFDKESGWAKDFKKGRRFLSGSNGIIQHSSDWQILETAEHTHDDDIFSVVFKPTKTGKQHNPKFKPLKLKRKGFISSYFETPTHFLWTEQRQAETRLCAALKAGGKIHCPLTATLPRRLQVLGARPAQSGSGLTREIWLAYPTEKLSGTETDIWVFDTEKQAVTRKLKATTARPLAVAFAGKDAWVLLGERATRTLRRVDEQGNCLGMLAFQDHILNVKGLDDGSLVLNLYAGDNTYMLKVPRGRFTEKACTREQPPISPLQFALATGGPMDFKSALEGASLWAQESDVARADATASFSKRPLADADVQAGSNTQAAEPAKWRPRPLFLFPWIGADDALGLQYGAISVPLMDHMQNETVRATFLYGYFSHFPYQELALTSTRFRPTLNLAVYREQTYDGRYAYNDDTGKRQIKSAFLDERGARFESTTPFRALGGGLSLGLGVKYANLQRYIGDPDDREGNLTEPAATVSLLHTAGRLTFTNQVSARTAPVWANRTYEYNQLGAATSVTSALPLDSKLTLGLEGSRTRGPANKGRWLKEMYVPLKTFVPGSGGGYNKNSFPIGDADTGLFSPVFGDTQGRAKANWTVPIFADIDKWWWLVYVERLDFTAFYNYGRAWNGNKPRVGWDKLIAAHGYSLDLQLENKGVRFNLGMGVGRVVRSPWERYLTTGFDALF